VIECPQPTPYGRAVITRLGRLLHIRGTAAPTGLWRSDGTRAGTALIKTLDETSFSSPNALVVSGGRLYFAADDGITGAELWALPLPPT